MGLEGWKNQPFWASSFAGFLDDAADRCPADVVSLGDLGQTEAAGAVTEDGGAIEVERGAADVPAFQLGPAHTGPNPLDNKVAFQLGDGADDDDDGAAQRAAGIDVLSEADELDAQVVQFVEHLEEVADGAGDPVRSPDEHNVKLPLAGIPQHLVEAGAARFGAADPVSGMKQVAKPWYSDQILPFDITLAGTNENGAATCMKIFGVEILNEGSGVSIDDAVTEMQATFVARFVEPWAAVS